VVLVNIKNFNNLVKTDKKAAKYFKRLCAKKGHLFCPNCGRSNPYHLASGRYRCRRCKSDFNLFSGRWLSSVRLPPAQWLWMIKLFDLEVSTRKAAYELDISYPTALRAMDAIRSAIIANSQPPRELGGEVEADESYFGGKRKGKRGRGAAGKVPVFGIIEREGRVWVQPVDDVSAETLMGETVRKVRRGSLVYTDKWKGYDSLMFYGYKHLKINHSKHFVREKVYINGMEGFWSYAKQRLMKFHGVDPAKFLLYLKEQEFRYNNRDKDLFKLVAKYLARMKN
jgi:transposase